MNVGEIKVNFSFVDDTTKPGLNRFGVRLTSKSEKHIAYEFRTLKNDDYKELAPGILKPGEIIELDRFLPVEADIDQDCCHLLYREVEAIEKDVKAAMRKEGYYDGELVVFKK